MASPDEARARIEAGGMVGPAWSLRRRAPELALILADRARAALAPARSVSAWSAADPFGDERARLRAEATIVVASSRLGQQLAVVARGIEAVRAAERLGDAEVVAALRVELAGCARAAGVPLVGAAVLAPVLGDGGPRAAGRADALVQLVGCLAFAVGSPDLDGAFAEADRIYADDRELDAEGRVVFRALLRAAASAHHRRRGDPHAAVAVAQDGADLLGSLTRPSADNGGVGARVALRLVHGLLDLGRVDEASAVAAEELARPVRAPAAVAVGWLAVTIAVRKHLAIGAARPALALLRTAADLAERYHLSALHAEALTTLADVHERVGELATALDSLRLAQGLRLRRAAAVHAARTALTQEFGAEHPPERFVRLLGQVAGGSGSGRRDRPSGLSTASGRFPRPWAPLGAKPGGGPTTGVDTGAGLAGAVLSGADRPRTLVVVDVSAAGPSGGPVRGTVGDRVLREVTARVRGAAPASAEIARIGVAEVVVLLPAAAEDQVDRWVADLRGAMDRVGWSTYTPPVAVSVRTAVADPLARVDVRDPAPGTPAWRPGATPGVALSTEATGQIDRVVEPVQGLADTPDQAASVWTPAAPPAWATGWSPPWTTEAPASANPARDPGSAPDPDPAADPNAARDSGHASDPGPAPDLASTSASSLTPASPGASAAPSEPALPPLSPPGSWQPQPWRPEWWKPSTGPDTPWWAGSSGGEAIPALPSTGQTGRRAAPEGTTSGQLSWAELDVPTTPLTPGRRGRRRAADNPAEPSTDVPAQPVAGTSAPPPTDSPFTVPAAPPTPRAVGEPPPTDPSGPLADSHSAPNGPSDAESAWSRPSGDLPAMRPPSPLDELGSPSSAVDIPAQTPPSDEPAGRAAARAHERMLADALARWRSSREVPGPELLSNSTPSDDPVRQGPAPVATPASDPIAPKTTAPDPIAPETTAPDPIAPETSPYDVSRSDSIRVTASELAAATRADARTDSDGGRRAVAEARPAEDESPARARHSVDAGDGDGSVLSELGITPSGGGGGRRRARDAGDDPERSQSVSVADLGITAEPKRRRRAPEPDTEPAPRSATLAADPATAAPLTWTPVPPAGEPATGRPPTGQATTSPATTGQPGTGRGPASHSADRQAGGRSTVERLLTEQRATRSTTGPSTPPSTAPPWAAGQQPTAGQASGAPAGDDPDRTGSWRFAPPRPASAPGVTGGWSAEPSPARPTTSDPSSTGGWTIRPAGSESGASRHGSPSADPPRADAPGSDPDVTSPWRIQLPPGIQPRPGRRRRPEEAEPASEQASPFAFRPPSSHGASSPSGAADPELTGSHASPATAGEPGPTALPSAALPGAAGSGEPVRTRRGRVVGGQGRSGYVDPLTGRPVRPDDALPDAGTGTGTDTGGTVGAATFRGFEELEASFGSLEPAPRASEPSLVSEPSVSDPPTAEAPAEPVPRRHRAQDTVVGFAALDALFGRAEPDATGAEPAPPDAGGSAARSLPRLDFDGLGPLGASPRDPGPLQADDEPLTEPLTGPIIPPTDLDAPRAQPGRAEPTQPRPDVPWSGPEPAPAGPGDAGTAPSAPAAVRTRGGGQATGSSGVQPGWTDAPEFGWTDMPVPIRPQPGSRGSHWQPDAEQSGYLRPATDPDGPGQVGWSGPAAGSPTGQPVEPEQVEPEQVESAREAMPGTASAPPAALPPAAGPPVVSPSAVPGAVAPPAAAPPVAPPSLLPNPFTPARPASDAARVTSPGERSGRVPATSGRRRTRSDLRIADLLTEAMKAYQTVRDGEPGDGGLGADPSAALPGPASVPELPPPPARSAPPSGAGHGYSPPPAPRGDARLGDNRWRNPRIDG